MNALPPGPGLYVHIPFCRARCGYCAFASNVYDAGDAARYLDALGVEFARRVGGRRFRTVFVGGGTPTSLGVGGLGRLLDTLRPATDGAVEFTVEANPGGFDRATADVLRRGGVNRLSFGAQTFHRRGLAALGRAQAPEDVPRAVATARATGFGRIGVDLIAGWPGQTLADWRADLDAALALGVEHVSCYGLSVEPGTPLARAVEAGAASTPDEEFARQAWDEAGRRLAAAGLARYEVSNHARPGAECVHNLNYWTGGDYLGLGAAAHSHEAGRRFANASGLADYLAAVESGRSAEVFGEVLPPDAKARETLTVWLRLAGGVDADAFAARAGRRLDDLLGDDLPRLVASGGLVWSEDGRRLRLTDDALPVADAVLSELVADPSEIPGLD